MLLRIAPAITDAFAVIDFETTGLPVARGGRAVEIGAVIIRNGKQIAAFQELMNPGVRMQAFAVELTGITDAMVASAPPSARVMRAVAALLTKFPGIPLIAHNAAFDNQVLGRELALAGLDPSVSRMSCSMLMARRVYPDAPNHKLGTLVDYARVPTEGTCHRALADSTLTARLLMRMAGSLRNRYGMDSVPIELLQGLTKVGAAKADAWLSTRAKDLAASQRRLPAG